MSVGRGFSRAGLAIVIALVVSCGEKAAPAPAASGPLPSILLVTLDTTRADSIGPGAAGVEGDAFAYSMNLRLELQDAYLIDLGLGAEQAGVTLPINPFDNPYDDPEGDVDGTIANNFDHGTDPNVLVGVMLPADAEATREMAYVFAEEFARLGYTREQLLWLFRNPFYGGAHGAYRSLGEQETLSIIDECLNAWGNMKIRVQDAEPPPLSSPAPRKGG